MRNYQQTMAQMMDQNKELFDTFKVIHDKYVLDPQGTKDEFNRIGRDVVDLIQVYDRRLCANMSTGKFGSFSSNLSQKFWGEIKKVFPKIDFVGVK